MKFAIQINSSPNSNSTSYTAFNFIKAALAAGHQVVRIFFYQEGIYHAFAHSTPPENEFQWPRQWAQLANFYELDLVVCISAAQRRGLLCADETARRGNFEQALADGFRISGLGQLVEASLLAERFIVFG